MSWRKKARIAGININPVAGLQQSCTSQTAQARVCRNQHQPSRGITTYLAVLFPQELRCRNQHQPSRGITTAAVSWAPVQSAPESTSTQSRDYNFSSSLFLPFRILAGININPVAGLQHPLLRIRVSWRKSRNQHQPSRWITTAIGGLLALLVTAPESTSTQSRDYNIASAVACRTVLAAGININPVAGLQLLRRWRGMGC